MRVELQSLQPNPMRDFTVDPIDQERVAELKQSIQEDGFWGGVVCRRTKNNGVQIAAGHHRIEAAKMAGIEIADVFIGEMDDAAMIRVYARENATQRGNLGTALAGSVAAAVRFLARGLLTGDIAGFPAMSDKAIESSQGILASDRGLGWDMVLTFLEGIPGINKNTVMQQLTNIKASGDYARIIREVQKRIEEENKAALEALKRQEEEQRVAEERAKEAEARRKEAEERRKEAAKAERAAREEAAKRRAEAEARAAETAAKRAEEEAKLAAKRKAEAAEEMKKFDALRKTRDNAQKATAKAESREKTFDFEGVAKHLKNASHIDVFRELATGETARLYLPLHKQKDLAASLVKLAAGGELSGRFIRENFMSQLMGVKKTEKKFNKAEEEDLLKRDWSAKAAVYQRDVAQNARGFLRAAVELSDHAKKRPSGVTLLMTGEFRTAIENIKRAITLMEKAGIV